MHQAYLGEWVHDNDPQAKIRCQRQDLPLELPLPGIIGDLNSGDTTCLHDLPQFSKVVARIQYGTNSMHTSCISQLLQHLQVFLPEDHGLDLIEIDVIVEEFQCALCLSLTFSR